MKKPDDGIQRFDPLGLEVVNMYNIQSGTDYVVCTKYYGLVRPSFYFYFYIAFFFLVFIKIIFENLIYS